MKTDVKAELLTALKANNALVVLLGGDYIYQSAAPDASIFPRITFFEIDNVPSAFADDEPIAADVWVQVDVWNKESTSDIAGEVNRTMKELGYTRTGGADLYEDDTKVFHKAMRFRAQFEEE